MTKLEHTMLKPSHTNVVPQLGIRLLHWLLVALLVACVKF